MKTIYAILASVLAVGSANASNFSFTGNFENNDEVQEFKFAVASQLSDVTLRTWSYAGGTNVAGAVIDRGGFDPVVSLFDSNGALIDFDDDGGGSVAADPVSNFAYDSFLIHSLSAGNYTATVTQFASFPNGDLASGFSGSGAVNFDGRDSHWALDILNVNTASLGTSYVSAIPPVPEPKSYALLLAGLSLVGFMARSQHRWPG